MKTVILYGGMGASLSEETGLRSKPMVEIEAGLFYGTPCNTMLNTN